MIFNYKDFLNERIKYTDDNFILIKQKNLFFLYDDKNNKPLGYICYGLTDGDVYSIYGAYSEHGYGPLMYEIVMTYVYPKGITLSDDSGTSGDALNVWNKFFERTDVKKEPIERTKKSDKEKDLIGGSDGTEQYSKWIEEILFLHNHKYTYTFGIDKLNKMIEKGDRYLQEHPDLDIQEMIYDLEDLL